MTPEQLKASILQYAMEGKLVSQNPNDEPASELLKKIEKEKAELIKEGKIKKSKKSSVITEDEKPFDIPDSWEWVRLKNLLKPEVTVKPNFSFKYIDIASLNNKINKITNYKTCIIGKDKIPVRATKLVSKGDILYSTVRPYLRNIAIVPDKLDRQIATSGFYVLKPFEPVNNRYLFYLLLSPYLTNAMHEKMKGINSPSIKKSDLKNFSISLPPLEEQKRIVAKIEKLMPLVAEYAEYYNKLQKIDNEFKDKLKQSILQYAMEGKLVPQDPNDEPASVLLEKIQAEKAELIKEKKIKKSKPLPPITDDEKPSDIPDIASLDNKTNLISDCKYYVFGKDKIPVRATKQVSKGDILYSTVRPYLRNIAIVPESLNNQVATSGFYVLKLLNNINTEYIFYFLMSPYVTNSMHRKMKGINSPSIKKSDLNNFLAPLPPIEEQKRIVDRIKELNKLLIMKLN